MSCRRLPAGTRAHSPESGPVRSRERKGAAWKLACLVLAAMFSSCARRAAEPAVERMAVLRFENMGGDPGTDWMGRAFSEVITAELAGAPGFYAIPASRLHSLGQMLGPRPTSAPGISAEQPLALAAAANRIAYGEYYVDRGVLHASLTIEDPRNRRMVRVLTPVKAAGSDVAAAATQLARQIWPQAPAYGARNPSALEAYADAVEGQNPAAIESDARKSLADDPDFGLPYLVLAQMKAQQQDRAGLAQVLQTAAARGAALPQIDRVRLQVLAAGLSGDMAARQNAVQILTKLTPNDPAAWREAAGLSVARREYPQGTQAYERALNIEPEDATSWNDLAYAAVSAGNLPTAMAALRRYQALRPTDPNPLDSMGDVNLMAGRLKDAEQFYLEALKMSPNFLNGVDAYKAALARLMTGDVAGADALFQKFPGAARRHAEWLWISGRRQQAYQSLAAQAPSLPSRDAQSYAYSELAIWALFAGDGPAAAQMAQKAGGLAGPASAVLAGLARFLAAPQLSPAEWTSRAQQFFPNAGGASAAPNARDLALAFAFLLNRQFEPAAGLLRRIYDGTASSPENDIPIELAWALVESGDTQKAAPLLRLNPVPSRNGPGPLMAFYFPQIFRLRAQVAEKQGKADEARANQRIFEALSGK